jgi:hypothetical protein
MKTLTVGLDIAKSAKSRPWLTALLDARDCSGPDPREASDR